MEEMPGKSGESCSRQPVLMCSSCWKIQPPEDELAFDVDQWVEPGTFMAAAVARSRHYLLVDAFCEGCLSDMMERAEAVIPTTAHERLNA
jgi:hypothetical protein